MEKYSRFRVMYKENLTQYERAAYVIHGMDPDTIAIVEASFETEEEAQSLLALLTAIPCKMREYFLVDAESCCV